LVLREEEDGSRGNRNEKEKIGGGGGRERERANDKVTIDMAIFAT
jgi:hypothetical protein